MKTTVEISDNLLRRAKEVARQQGKTLREVLEEGLARALETREAATPYHVEPVVFKGEGLTPEFQNAAWAQIRDASYEGRGG